MGEKLRRRLGDAGALSLYVIRRFNRDGCFAASGALSYTTLISLVPACVIALGVLSGFPGFGSMRAELLGFIFRNLVPAVGEEAARWVQTFADSAAKTTALGIAGIAATGILLLATIEDQLNQIWRVTVSRPWGQRIFVYWTLITLGPLLIGASLTVSTYFSVAARRAGLDTRALEHATRGWLDAGAGFVPFLLELTTFTLLFRLMPACLVRWRHALTGAMIAAAAIEGLKSGFAVYVGSVASYHAVYGTLAAIPIFLLWMYISWMAVLLGAVVTASLPSWRADPALSRQGAAGLRLALSLALIGELARAQRVGGTVRTDALAADLDESAALVDELLMRLVTIGLVARTQANGWVLSWSLAKATLGDVYRALDLPLAAGWEPIPQIRWHARVAPAMRRIIAAEGAAMSLALAALLNADAATPHPHAAKTAEIAQMQRQTPDT
jgi:membrane protein